MRRRPTLAALASACVGWPRPVRAGDLAPLPLNVAQAVAQLAAGGPTGLLAVSVRGTLYAVPLDGKPAQLLADGLDPETPLAIGHDRIAARRQDGALWVLQRGSVGLSKPRALAAAAGLLVLPLAIIGVEADDAGHRVVRMEATGGSWSPVARSTIPVLPDARPLQADLDGRGDGGHIVVLAGPDGERYRHGVLGDTIEATRICLLERHSLALLRDQVLAAPFVFEDIAPRRFADGARDLLLTVRAGPQGAQLVLVDADPATPAALRIAASGAAIGTVNRWLSPTTDGRRWLAVHTPHIGGVLHEYRRDGSTLPATRLRGDVSNHTIGSRWLDLAAWQGPWLLMPDQRRTRLLLLDGRAGWQQIQAWSLPSRLIASIGLAAARGTALLFEDGSVALVRLPA